MRVLFINSVSGYGSTGTICKEIGDRLSRRGGEARIAYGRRSSAAADHISYRIASRTDVMLHGIGARLLDRAGFFSARATGRLIEMIREYSPDVIHLHNLHGYYLHVGILFDFLRTAGIPVVWTLHDCWAFTGHCAHFSYVGCDRYKTLCHSCPEKRSYPASVLLDGSSRSYERKRAAFSDIPDLMLTVPSRWLADRVGESFLSQYRTQIVSNGVDLSVFRPTEGNFRKKHSLTDKTVLLGVAYGWSDRKGLDVFCELSRRLDERFAIVVAGVDERVRRRLAPRIIALPRTESQAELAELYTAADLFVNPTREESLGLVNIEALACGTPGITFAAGGSPECYDEKTGCVVQVDDIDAMESEIKRITETRPFAAEDCIARATAFDRTICIDRYLALYQGMLSR